MSSTNLRRAKVAKDDEFYTKRVDIEAELQHYRSQIAGKVIYCNCDNPEWSNFWRYFYDNYAALQLGGLISTHLSAGAPAYRLDYNGKELRRTELQGGGDFRSQEALGALREADVVVTNPPFSLFRDLIALLTERKKDFLLIGNFNAVAYKVVFPLIKAGRVRLGVSPRSMTFTTPNGQEREVNACWFTTLDATGRQKGKLGLGRYRGNKDKYPTYDNYNAINVDRVKDLPGDYGGVMGVPITYLDVHDPDQFDIIGLGDTSSGAKLTKEYANPRVHFKDGRVAGGGAVNRSLVYEVAEPPEGATYYTSDNSGYLIAPFRRVLIQKKVQACGG